MANKDKKSAPKVHVKAGEKVLNAAANAAKTTPPSTPPKAAATSQVAKIAEAKGAKPVDIKKQPVQMDPKKIAADIMKAAGTPSTPTTKAPVASKAKAKAAVTGPNANAVGVLRATAKGAQLYGFAAKDTGTPFWLRIAKPEKWRVEYERVKQYVQPVKTDEETGVILYGLTAAGKQVIAQAAA
jgi:hypothetical protein